jgi:hypothetical protein
MSEGRYLAMRTAILLKKLLAAWLLMSVYFAGNCFAAAPIELKINLDKTVYSLEEPIGLRVVARNTNGDLLISEGFSQKVFYLAMRMFDPAGRLVVASNRQGGFNREFPDAPPLAWVMYNGAPIQVANCEVLPGLWQNTDSQRVNDLRQYYDILLPGYYSLQVQVSATIYKGDSTQYCNVNDYEWKGLLKSDMVFFYVRASTENIHIVPNEWKTKWMNDDRNVPDIKVQIPFKPGESGDSFIAESITLGTCSAVRVQALNPMLVAYFNARELIEKLGIVEVGTTYTLYVSGLYTNNQRFFKEAKIRIVN